jgi:integrase
MLKKSWWVDFSANHMRYRKRSPENTKAGAEAYEAVLRQKLARGESIDSVEQPTLQKHTFEQFASKWFESYVMPNNTPLEQRAKKYILRGVLVPFFGKFPIEQITTQHIEQFKAKTIAEGLARKTVNNRLAVFSKCLATAYEWLQLKGTPPKVMWLKCPPHKTDFLSADECALVLSNSEGIIHEMVLLALRTGMRHGEITGLQWSSIDWQNRIISVRHTWCDRIQTLGSPKSNRERHIPMDADVYEMLFKRKKSTGYVFLRKERPWGSNPLIKELREVRYKVGLRPFTWHTLRHTFASHLAMRNTPLHVVQALLGHSSIGTTMRYAHVAPSMLRNAIDTLNPKQAFSSPFGQPVGNQWLVTEQVNSEKH